MSGCPEVSRDGRSVTVHIALKLRRYGGRKLVLVPDGAPAWTPMQPRVDSKLVRALTRAHRWQQQLDFGEYATPHELAAAEKIDRSFLCRMLRLALLAPDLVEAVLNGRQPPGLELTRLLRGFPAEWGEQRKRFGLDEPTKAFAMDTDLRTRSRSPDPISSQE